MRSRDAPPTIASTCGFRSGPGSITATSSMPPRYVLVPGPVMALGLLATTRRTNGDNALGTSVLMARSLALLIVMRSLGLAASRLAPQAPLGFGVRQWLG